MTFFLTTLPLWLSAVILIVPTTLLAMAGPVIVRRYVEVSQLRTNNEVAGFKFGTVGVLYAVLLAFAVVVVWEKFNQAESEVAKEAGAAATVFRLTQGVDPERGAAIREATTDYLTSAIASDWPAMESGTQSPATTEALNEIYHAILKFQSLGTDERLVLAEILRHVDRISEARRERRVMADGIVPGDHLGGAFRRRLSDHRVHLLFRFGKLARSVGDDRRFVSPDLCRVADRCGHRSSVRRHGESRTGGSCSRG